MKPLFLFNITIITALSVILFMTSEPILCFFGLVLLASVIVCCIILLYNAKYNYLPNVKENKYGDSFFRARCRETPIMTENYLRDEKKEKNISNNFHPVFSLLNETDLETLGIKNKSNNISELNTAKNTGCYSRYNPKTDSYVIVESENEIIPGKWYVVNKSKSNFRIYFEDISKTECLKMCKSDDQEVRFISDDEMEYLMDQSINQSMEYPS